MMSQNNANVPLRAPEAITHSTDGRLIVATSGNEETQTQTANNYQTENQKIEYVTKSYAGSAWCCQSSEIPYDQSQFEINRPRVPP